MTNFLRTSVPTVVCTCASQGCVLSPVSVPGALSDVFAGRLRTSLPYSLPSFLRQPRRLRPVRPRSPMSCGVWRGGRVVRPGADQPVRIPRAASAGRFSACRRCAVVRTAELSPRGRRDGPVGLFYKCRPGRGPRSPAPQGRGEGGAPGAAHVARGRIYASSSSGVLLGPETVLSASPRPGVSWGYARLVMAAVAFWRVACWTRAVFDREWPPRMEVVWPGAKRSCVHVSSERRPLLLSDVRAVCLCGGARFARLRQVVRCADLPSSGMGVGPPQEDATVLRPAVSMLVGFFRV